ncbi:TPA: hypothetical protein ACH3X3_012196 [Trebouxia sp. C0006]
MIRDAWLAPAGIESSDHLGPVSASPQYVAEALVYFANLNAEDILFDLGCNDEHLQDRVSIICGNALESDLSTATAVFLYLLPKGMSRLLQKLQAELQPGCKVITYMFRIPDWQAYHQKSEGISSNNPSRMDVSAVSKLHLYCLPQR